MRRWPTVGAASVLATFAPCVGLSQSGPAERVPTPPRSVVSPQNAAARPVPIADLFFSHRVLSPAWSPDGKQIVFTTNVTGRYNL